MHKTLAYLMLLLSVAGSEVAAQAADDETLEDEAREIAAAAAEEEATSAEREALEPAVPTLARDVRRRTNSRGVMDEIELARTEITGNQELPKVMYIVPWQKSDPGDLTGKPVNTLLDEVLAPIDRSEFIRQVEYYGELYGEDEE